MKNSSNILVISNGLLGSNIAHHLNCDLISHKKVFSESLEKYDFVINTSFDEKMLTAELNKEAFDFKLIDKLADTNSKYIFLSTRKVYGRYGGESFKENSICAPICFYGRNKLMLEKYIQHRLTNRNYLILRLPNIYDSESLNKRNSFLGTFGFNLIHENEVRLNCSLNTYKDFLSVKNFLVLFDQIYHKTDLNGKILNISIGEKISLSTVVKMAEHYFTDLKIIYDEATDDSFLLSNYLLSEYANISGCVSNKIELDNHFKLISKQKI